MNGKKGGVEELILPIMTISQIMGTTYYKKTLENNKKKIFLYRIIILSFIIMVLVHEIPTMIFWTRNTEGIHAILAFMETRLRWGVVIINLIVNSGRNGKFNEVVEELTNTELNVYDDKKKITWFQIFILSSTLTLLICYMCLGVDVLWINPYYHWYTSSVYIITEFYTGFANVQFVVVLFVIKKHLTALKEDIRNSDFKLMNGSKKKDVMVFFVCSKFKRDDIGEIVKFRQIHMNLMNVCYKTNDCFCIQVSRYFIVESKTNLI